MLMLRRDGSVRQRFQPDGLLPLRHALPCCTSKVHYRNPIRVRDNLRVNLLLLRRPKQKLFSQTLQHKNDTYDSAGLGVGGGLSAAERPEHREGGGEVLEGVRLGAAPRHVEQLPQ